MYANVGVERDAAGLTVAVERLQALARTTASAELRDAATVGTLVARAALGRRESRGSHQRTDFPVTAPAQNYRSFSSTVKAPAGARSA